MILFCYLTHINTAFFYRRHNVRSLFNLDDNGRFSSRRWRGGPTASCWTSGGWLVDR